MRKFYILFFIFFNCLFSQKISLLPTPFDMSVDQFRGGESKTEVIINLMIPKKLFHWVDYAEAVSYPPLPLPTNA